MKNFYRCVKEVPVDHAYTRTTLDSNFDIMSVHVAMTATCHQVSLAQAGKKNKINQTTHFE